jgi:hypothetical protein
MQGRFVDCGKAPWQVGGALSQEYREAAAAIHQAQRF